MRGEIVLHPFNGDLDPAQLPVPLRVRVGEREMTLLQARGAGDRWLVRLDGVADRDAAAALTNSDLALPRSVLPPLAPGELYVGDLVGCEVRDVDGRVRGVVRGTFWNGAHDVLTVVDEAGTELLVPATPEFLRAFDAGARVVVVDPHE